MINNFFLIIFGPQGSGKGTQADLLAEKLKIPVICPGELLRHEVEVNSAIGREVKPIIDAGVLVPDHITEGLINKMLNSGRAKKGAIFDGVPRRKSQQTFLIKELHKRAGEQGVILAILINASSQEVRRRIGGRRECDCGEVYHLVYNPPRVAAKCDKCGKKLHIREDDKPAAINRRLSIYHKDTEPLLAFWRKSGKLIEVNGEQSIKTVAREINKELKLKGINSL